MEGEILKGHLDLIVLAALSGRPAHGYAVIEEIRRKSGKAFDLPEGTIYPALHRLDQAGLEVRGQSRAVNFRALRLAAPRVEGYNFDSSEARGEQERPQLQENAAHIYVSI